MENILRLKPIHGFNIVGIKHDTQSNLPPDTIHSDKGKSLEKKQNQSDNSNKVHESVTSQNQNHQLSIIYRINERQVKPLSNNYLVVIDQAEKLINGKPASFDIFNLKYFINHVDIIKQLKRLNRKSIGIEIKISDIRSSSHSHDVGRWIRCIKDIYKFSKLSNNQFILSSGTNYQYDIVSNNSFESILRLCEIDPQTYWQDLEKWLDIKKKVYYDVTS